jgi:Type II secretion system (T2SS), protein E, N-terminal domain
VGRKRIGELLLDQGAIDDRQLQGALQYQRDHGGRLGSALVAKGALTEEQLVKVLGQTLNIPVVDIPDHIDVAALKLIKAQFCEDHDVFPLHLDDARSTGRRTLTMALADPLDIPTLEEIEFVTGCRVQPALATPSQIRVAILRHYFRQNIDQRRQGGRMTVVRRGGSEEEIDTTRSSSSTAVPVAKPAAKPSGKLPPRFGDEDEVMSLTDEVTSRTELAELIRERERARTRNAGDDNLKFLTGETDAERVEQLERKFWALMRILASRGLITKDEFLAEFNK